MARKEISIDCLPEWILEEIFSYLQDKKVMRLVSKNFKNIVDNSKKLMSNYWMNIKAKDLKDSNNVVNCFYQNILIDCENCGDLAIINQYKWSKNVKSIKLKLFGPDLFKTFEVLQPVLFSSENLEEIVIDVLCEPSNFAQKSRVKFKYLKKLSVYSNTGNCANIIGYFVDSPNLKILSIQSEISDFVFLSKEASWQLEELELLGKADFMLYFDKFLEKQSGSLKILRIDPGLILNDITRILQNLEILHLICFSNNILYFKHVEDEIVNLRRISSDILSLNDEALVPNDTLKILSIINVNLDSETLQKILMHYNNIEQLYIHTKKKLEFENLELSNLKHISVSSDCSELLWRLKMENLKSLTLHGRPIDLNVLERIPAENLKNVDTLKAVTNNNYISISVILGFFPALKHLVLLFEYLKITDEFLDGILAESDLKSISIAISCWKLEKSPQEYLSSVGNEQLIIKLYSKFSEIIQDQDIEIKYFCNERFKSPYGLMTVPCFDEFE